VAVDADANPAPTHLPKTEAKVPERAPRTLRRPSPKRPYLERQTDRKPITVAEAGIRNAAKFERARRTQPKQRAEHVSEEQHQPKPMSDRREPQNHKLLFCRLTPELSRAAKRLRLE